MAASDKFARLAALRPVGRMNDALTQTWHSDADPRMPDECALARLLGATVTRTKFGSHLSVRNWHATPEFCAPSSGVIQLLLSASSGKKRGAIGSPQLAEDPEKWLFLDTETTGLAGGTGTYAFLIGIAWWDGGGLQVEQFLMRDFSEEHSVLVELAERIAERPVLVTFNGKTFDWPLLENRYVMTRNIRVPKLATHLDLLHPARAVWKLRLGSVRLVELEREVLDPQRLGWCREDDVPSSLIPQFYFDYLRGGAPAPLLGVVRHNLMDLRGLAALFGRLNSLLSTEEELVGTEALDLLGLSRYLRRRGEPKRAESTCMAARNLGLPPPVDGQAQRELALMAKRRGEHAAAAKIWEALLQDEDSRALACEELSIYYERRAKNLQRALEFARLGLRYLCGTGGGISSTMSRKAAGDVRRAEQLTKKLLRLEGRIAAAASQRSEPLLQSR